MKRVISGLYNYGKNNYKRLNVINLCRYRLIRSQFSHGMRPITGEGLVQYLQLQKASSDLNYFIKLKQLSMLHHEVLSILELLARSIDGRVVEFGAYIGGSSIVLANALSNAGKKSLVTVEPGGKNLEHEFIPSNDILKDWELNLVESGSREQVNLVRGYSSDQAVFDKVKNEVEEDGIGLLFIDSDGHVARDIEKYGCLLLNKCVLVLDDYESDLAPEKSALIKDWVDSSIDSGQVCSLGIYGWGTWVGVYNKTSHLSS